ncbi:MAG: DUF2812 domain-containing protein [Clostridium sp.]|uniref:DUF2812 domain-containing protein n=1 Tax=Clostridium sp. TaxID=1506 RepID=UPI0030685B67
MKKLVTKLNPCDFWRIGETESWFTDMAAKGLHLQSVGYYSAKFEKHGPKKMKYRIEVAMNNDDISGEQICFYREYGWEYVTCYDGNNTLIPNKFYVFSSPEELNAHEIHTDPVEQSYTLKYLNKQLLFNALLALLWVVLFFVLVFLPFIISNYPYLSLMNFTNYLTLFVSIAELYFLIKSIVGFLSILSLKKSLKEGIPINHNANWKPYKLISLLIITIHISLIIVLSYLTSNSTTLELSIDEANEILPIIRLSEIEDYTMKYDLGSSCNYSTTMFSPVTYRTYEKFRIFTNDSLSNTLSSDSLLNTKVYKVRFSFMADNLLNDLVKQEISSLTVSEKEYLYLEGATNFKPLSAEDIIDTSNDDFDILKVANHDYGYKIFAAKGKCVVFINYFGDVDIEKVLDVLSEKMSMLED